MRADVSKGLYAIKMANKMPSMILMMNKVINETCYLNYI